MSIICSFDKKENKFNYYRGKDYAKIMPKKKKSAIEIINREKKEIIPLTQKEINRYNEKKICYTCNEKFCLDKNDENYANRKRLKIIVIILENLEDLPTVFAI